MANGYCFILNCDPNIFYEARFKMHNLLLVLDKGVCIETSPAFVKVMEIV